MDLILDQEPYRQKSTRAVERVRVASRGLVTGLQEAQRISPGTYRLFSHNAHLGLRAEQILIILKRLFDGRERLRRLDAIRAKSPVVIGQKVPNYEEWRAVHEALRLDFESLYIFGNVALDLWASVAAHVRGLATAQTATFDLFRKQAADPTKAKPELLSLVQGLASQVLWLSALVRFYRNRFIVHVARPWQISSTHPNAAYDFHLTSTLNSPGARIQLGRDVTDVASSLGISMLGGTPQLLLFVLLMRIGEISEQVVRKKILDLYAKHGTLTPSFHTVGDRLTAFLADAMELTTDLALREPVRVDLGVD